MKPYHYLMESDAEAQRLELKTDPERVTRQALWAGMKKGMRVADIGCGIGKTTSCFHALVEPEGEVVGVEISEKRLQYAKHHYRQAGVRYTCKDIRKPLTDLGLFDFVWVRFVLEYHRSESFNIVRNLSDILKPGGILCLIDIDYNCLSHFGMSERLERALFGLMKHLEQAEDFDPFAGRKLYSYLYDLNYEDIDMDLTPHHLIFGDLNEADAYNWAKKTTIAGVNGGYRFEEYDGGIDEFIEDFNRFFNNPRRFTYSPLISCRGAKPRAG